MEKEGHILERSGSHGGGVQSTDRRGMDPCRMGLGKLRV